jgi:hypothetical protein
MNIETIELRKIIASEGMILTNGESYGKIIFLSDDADVSLWYEITEEKYNEIQKLVAEAIENEMM